MAVTSKYIFVVSMDVDPDKEGLFNEVYDTEHVPALRTVPGVHAVARFKGEPFAMMLGGEKKSVEHPGARYTAIYEIDSPQVLLSPEWAKQAEAGRWPAQVRPHTRNRHHMLYKVR